MEDVLDGSVWLKRFAHIVSDELKVWVRGEMGDVGFAARDEVIDAQDAYAFRDEPIAQVRADEPRSSRDEDVHLTYHFIRFRPSVKPDTTTG